MQNSDHDVVVVGAGPVGLATARMLGQFGHDVVVIERRWAPYPLPRAVHFDDEIGRVFQSMGLSEAVVAVTEDVPDFFEWRNAAGDVLLRVDWSRTGLNGWPTASFFSQPELERVLAESLSVMPNVRLVRGADVVGIEEYEDRVVVHAGETQMGKPGRHIPPLQASRAFAARYVIGCDGATSVVRDRMGVDTDEPAEFGDWLIVDTIATDDRQWLPMNWLLCDPVRPTMIISGGPKRRRWAFKRLPGEEPSELETSRTAWRLLAAWGRSPVNTRLEGCSIFPFAARCAARWNSGRLLIAGDAAHQLPSFADQGICAGLRDSANLAWKLDLVLRGVSEPTLLDTYSSERIPHVQQLIAKSAELGKLICVLDPEEAAQRDARMIAGGADRGKALPEIATPALGSGVSRAECALGGTLAPQFAVEVDRSPRLLDIATGSGAVLLLASERPVEQLLDSPIQARLAADEITAKSIAIKGEPDFRDFTGQWQRWFLANSVAAVIIRPDHYVYGAIPSIDEIADLVDGYCACLHVSAISDRLSAVV